MKATYLFPNIECAEAGKHVLQVHPATVKENNITIAVEMHTSSLCEVCMNNIVT